MAKLKLQILLVPAQFSEVPTEELDPYSIRRFLHLTETISDLTTVSGELSLRYQKIYGESVPLVIDKLQDNNRCDLDYDFEVGEVFNSGEILRVVVRSPMGRSNFIESTPMNGRTTHLVQSTPLLPLAPVLTRDANTSSHKITQEYFEKADPLIPSKRVRPNPRFRDSSSPVEGKHSSTSHYEKVIDASKSHIKDDSHVSLPPPDTELDQLIPEKKRTKRADNSTLTGGTRITSGMLNLPLHTQLNRTESLAQSPPPDPHKSSISDSSSSVISSPSRSSVVVKRKIQNDSTNNSSSNIQVNGTQENVYEENDNDRDLGETISKEEILQIFREGVRNYNRDQKSEHDVNPYSSSKQKNSLIKSLEINMVGANSGTNGRLQRAAAGSANRRSSGSSQSQQNSSTKKSSKLSKPSGNENLEVIDNKQIEEKDELVRKQNQSKVGEKNGTTRLEHSASTEDKLHLIFEKMKTIDNKLSSLSATGDDMNIWLPDDPILEDGFFNPNLNLVSNVDLNSIHNDIADYSSINVEPSNLVSFINDNELIVPTVGNEIEQISSITNVKEIDAQDEKQDRGKAKDLIDSSTATVKEPVRKRRGRPPLSPNTKAQRLAEKANKTKKKSSPNDGKNNIPKSESASRRTSISTGANTNKINSENTQQESDPKTPRQQARSNHSESSDSDSASSSNSDSDSEANDSKQPRLVASIPEKKKTTGLKRKEIRVQSPDQSNKSTTVISNGEDKETHSSNSSISRSSEGYHTPELNQKTIENYKLPEPKEPSGTRINTIRKPNLTSLDDLASRGLPEVRDNNTYISASAKVNAKKQVSDDSSSSDSSNSDSSSSSDSSDSDSQSDQNSSKFISLKKVKKPQKSKKSNVFYSLVRDAKGV